MIKASLKRRILQYATSLSISGVVLFSLGSWKVIDKSLWQHLADVMLPEAAINTAILATFTALSTTILGTTLAALVTFYEFPGKNLVKTGLLLPMAIPPYIHGFILLGLFEYSGPLATSLLTLGVVVTGPRVSGMPSLVFALTIALFPYPYLLTRSVFENSGRYLDEAAESLGRSKFATIMGVHIPMARPAILGGLSLVALECLADFGTVYLFNVTTLSTLVYKAWYGFYSLNTAGQISSLFSIPILLIWYLELKFTKKEAETSVRLDRDHLSKRRRSGSNYLALVITFVILFFSLILPCLQLTYWAVPAFKNLELNTVFAAIRESILIALCVGLLVSSIGVYLAWQARHDQSKIGIFLRQLAQVGYALPGTVLGVAVFITLTTIFGVGSQVSLSILPLIIGLAVRFFALGFQTLKSGLAQIPYSYEEEALLTGVKGFRLFRLIFAPLLTKPMIAAFLLVFVDSIKEMPLTLMTRPMGWSPISIKIYEFTSEGDWQNAAPYALLLILIGFIPTAFIAKMHRS